VRYHGAWQQTKARNRVLLSPFSFHEIALLWLTSPAALFFIGKMQ
jgi:hypothetical protein